MYFDVGGKQIFATTGGKAFDNKKPMVMPGDMAPLSEA